jgi:hypothetical protein
MPNPGGTAVTFFLLMVNDLCLNVSARTNLFHTTFILEGKKPYVHSFINLNIYSGTMF